MIGIKKKDQKGQSPDVRSNKLCLRASLFHIVYDARVGVAAIREEHPLDLPAVNEHHRFK